MSKKIAVIGSGFSGISAATTLAKEGHRVVVFEKNNETGGRARTLKSDGFVFDMGPSWYWMPDIYEDYFSAFNKRASDFYELKLLDPAFTIFFGKNDYIDVPNSTEKLFGLFDREEKGGAEKLKRFLADAEVKYKLAVKDLIYAPGNNIFEFFKFSVLKNILRLNVFSSFHSHTRKYFSNERLIQLIEFPVLFLGAVPRNTPALYSLMNYASFKLNTWYPIGGFSKVIESLITLAEDYGVEIRTNEAVKSVEVKNNNVHKIITEKGSFDFDAIIASSDYYHTEQLLQKKYRNYPDKYWTNKTLAPSCLIFYLGVSKKINNLRHHNLFFDESLDAHSEEIYVNPQWPDKPCFYVCCPSKTDNTVAPQGKENIFILMPIAPDINDDESLREKYFDIIINRMENILQENIKDEIEYKKSYCINDFMSDYNAFKGNAYGLANTLKQTAVLRPAIRSNKISNLFYAGHLTVPGPGVPPAIISGQIAAKELMKVI